MEQCVLLVDCWFSFIAYLCHQEHFPVLHSAGIPFIVSLSIQRLCQVPAYAGCLPIRHSRHAQERDKLAACVRPISSRPMWFQVVEWKDGSCLLVTWSRIIGVWHVIVS